MKKTENTPPSHLSADTKQFWSEVVDSYELDSHHIRLLLGCCESWDRAETARRTLKREGLFFTDRFGAPRVHPAADLELKSRNQFRLLLRELALDIEPPNESRMAGRSANSHLRLSR